MKILAFPPPASLPLAVAAELDRLARLSEIIPAISVFGDDNLAALSAQIYVISNRLDSNAAACVFEDDGDYVMSAALTAAEWRGGKTALPSESWSAMS